MINSKDISVVVQGAISKKYTKECLNSIIKHLPDAEIILSTWEGSDVSDLDYDKLMLNKDPGAEIFTKDGRKHNINRQILSTQNGIKVSNRKYVLKIRSDIKLLGSNFLRYFDKDYIRVNDCKILEKRVLVNSLYTRPSTVKHKAYLFHPSDWIMFGLKNDLENIWDIPLAPEPETSQYFLLNHEEPQDKNCLTRYHAEQYIWISFLKKNGIKVEFDNYYSYNDELNKLSELSIVNNLFILEYRKEFDLVCCKYPFRYGDSITLHPEDWLLLYKKYCDKNYSCKNIIPSYDKHQIFLHYYKLIANIINIFRNTINIIFRIVSILYHALHYFIGFLFKNRFNNGV